eukprot:TRINITY_DN30137_c0_g1_i1.p1 TRINITY_DN30137_c0_g1~~TRINITY_DN30137_c0_g1_i1.p1  ORF type:complete len:231 (-),score=25.18 TRINITY_DN30137_c0_g1_i1:49-705(-)
MLAELASGLVGLAGVSTAAWVTQTCLQFVYFKCTGQPTASSSRLAIFALAFPYSIVYVIGCMANRFKFDDYAETRDCFCKYHRNTVNLATHALGVPLMVYGWLCCLDAFMPGISKILACLYVVMLAKHLPATEWLLSVIGMAALTGAANLYPIGIYGILMGLLNECATQVSHDLYEPAYSTEYESKPFKSFMHSVLEHDFFLLPFCAAAVQQKIFPKK